MKNIWLLPFVRLAAYDYLRMKEWRDINQYG